MPEYLLIGIISLLTSLVSGLLGLGGAILLIPAYLYLPPLFGIETIGIKSISGITSVQVFFTSMVGLFFHHRKGAVDAKLIWLMGIPITVTAFAGAYLSGYVSGDFIIAVFAFLALTGGFFMLKKKSLQEEKTYNYSRVGAVFIAIFVGFFGGIAGAPGAFILSPLMMGLLKIPTRIVIGSTLGVVVLSASAASIGKITTGQVPFLLTLSAVLFAFPGAYAGTQLSHLLKTKTLRWLLAIVISAVGLEMWYKVISNLLKG
jgi:uncharacterized protein